MLAHLSTGNAMDGGADDLASGGRRGQRTRSHGALTAYPHLAPAKRRRWRHRYGRGARGTRPTPVLRRHGGRVSDLAAFARRRRSIEQLLADTGHGEGGDLSRSLGFTALTMLSIGAMVGTAIFFVLGTTVADAGPAVLMSFTVAGFLSILSALSYAELASAIPVSGSAYSYAYALFGHFAAWMTGVFLTMEYGLSISAVAVGWGAYINDFLASFGLALPDAIAAPPGDDAGHHRRDPGDRGRGLPFRFGSARRRSMTESRR